MHKVETYEMLSKLHSVLRTLHKKEPTALKLCLRIIIDYFKKAPVPWGISGGVNAMMESRQKVRQKLEQRELWERRYGEIVKKHK